MIDTTYSPCHRGFDRRRLYVSGNEKYVSVSVDLAKMKRMNDIFDLNVRLGSVDPCQCPACSPKTDTVNNE